MNFTEKDRKLIMQIAKQYKYLDERLAQIEELSKTFTSVKENVQIKKPAESIFGGHVFGDQTIEVVFKDKTGNGASQRVLIEAIYKTLKDICEKNGVETLQIKINN